MEKQKMYIFGMTEVQKLISKLSVMTVFIFLAVLFVQASANDQITKYNVVWDSPGKDYNGSMPIGNGDIGANVWVENDGDLLFYISKTDAFSEIIRLLKFEKLECA